jgi:hypothetical protein
MWMIYHLQQMIMSSLFETKCVLSLGKAPIVRCDVFLKSQCPQSDNEKTQMQAVPYASIVGSFNAYSSVHTT